MPGSALVRDDTPLFATIVHSAFYVLLAASLLRFLIRHPDVAHLWWVVGLSLVLAVAYALGEWGSTGNRGLRFGLVVAVWVVLVLFAPSFAWCAVPLLYTGLRLLPTRAALALVVALTALVVVTQVRLAGWADPNLLLAPPAVAAVATALFLGMRRHTEQQDALIADLRATRATLAVAERRAGTLAERERLAVEIHDTLAQGLSSQQMLLQAADRVWDADAAAAREHVRTAAAITASNLAEARRFVHDLAPADLAGSGSLAAALRAVVDREPAPPVVRLHVEGPPVPLPERTEAALLRIAQGALANVREHARAEAATITLTYVGDEVMLDVADDGRGFDPAAPVSDGGRGHGLPAIDARIRQLGGRLTIESAPGQGTALSVAVPAAGAEPSAAVGDGEAS